MAQNNETTLDGESGFMGAHFFLSLLTREVTCPLLTSVNDAKRVKLEKKKIQR